MLIFAVTKFTQGAWGVVVLFPVMVWGLIRLNRQYVTRGVFRLWQAGEVQQHRRQGTPDNRQVRRLLQRMSQQPLGVLRNACGV